MGHYIGSHTMSHLVCPASKTEVVFNEFCESKKYLEKLLKSECEHFSFPGGLFTKRDFTLAKKANFKYIFSTFEKFPAYLKNNKVISRIHIRQSTLTKLNSIFELKKSYYLSRYFRSCLKEFRDICKFKTL